ncbi:SIS domain-containing protein [uncultured Victivallis sp.]|uniref:D-sedoheptulose-7-phosphate isomerase n=1 Tax=uncultured Victivallis sp. TaxID=354118 RepID=UPI0025D2E0B8|nr:SIS domain-containing protein [uncultured Victivallis sp.]
MDREVDQFLERHPELSVCRESLNNMVETVVQIFRNGGTLFTCGNGGSAADSEHICGEFLKGFLSLRPLNADRRGRFESLFGDEGAKMAAKLQNGLRCISLLSHPAYVSAFANDVDAELVFGQQLWALGREGDALLAISTGGNAGNVKRALMVAKVIGMRSILLTGNRHGCCETYADCVVAVPESETYRIQELHLPVYHFLCMAVESRMFGGGLA